MLSCLDSFLFVLVVLPVRAVIAFLSLMKRHIQGGRCAPYAWPSHRSRDLHPVQKVDLAKFLLLVVGWFGISWMNIGGVSGYVRQETLVKLKILFTLLELLDRLMGNYGEHILGSLFWALEARPELVKRGIAWHALLALGYIGAAAALLMQLTVPVIHSHVVILHCSVFDAAMNGKSQALLTLLLLVQFAEMKVRSV